MKKNNNDNLKPKNIKKIMLIIVLIIAIVLLILTIAAKIYFTNNENKSQNNNENKSQNKINIDIENNYLSYRLTGNSLENFDLYFLQLENNKKNKIYSPLSIKYTLEMLATGSNGETKEQISNIIGEYNSQKYDNNSNMSFANALFVNNSFKESILDTYTNILKEKYNAEVIYDSFTTSDNINDWVNNKTFKLVNNIVDDVSNKNFILINSLAIDMEWVNKIQSETKDYIVSYSHENYSKYIDSLTQTYYHQLDFENIDKKTKSVEIGAVSNKYNIISEIGESKIRETVTNEYNKWLENEYNDKYCEKIENFDEYLDEYITDISKNYQNISSSTDFNFYVDDNVKVFSKDLKEYNNTTLQYIGIMPTNESLDKYISNITADDINLLINNLKSIELNSFKDGIITEIYGYIPLFNFDYELNLIKDLSKLGITDVFDTTKADLSNLSRTNMFIDSAEHKATIEFSNDGIKAGAATGMGGKGAGGCWFDYLYEVPIEKIDLTFDKPYMFIIRDKNTGEVWFVGTVYEPSEYKEYTVE